MRDPLAPHSMGPACLQDTARTVQYLSILAVVLLAAAQTLLLGMPRHAPSMLGRDPEAWFDVPRDCVSLMPSA
jgi:hypothetical protein